MGGCLKSKNLLLVFVVPALSVTGLMSSSTMETTWSLLSACSLLMTNMATLLTADSSGAIGLCMAII